MPSLLKPPPLLPGDTIGVVAPASLPQDLGILDTAVERLRASGYEVVLERPAWLPHGYLASDDVSRLAAFNAMLRRPDLHALLCVRGGYGALRLLPHLDYEAARKHPKLLIGYSDITALHLSLYKHAGLTGISGPVLVEWTHEADETIRRFHQMAAGQVVAPLENLSAEPLRTLRPGTAEGPLLGGNLAVLTRLLGTPYLPDLSGALLFLEDVGERVYRIDGMLAHLKLAGVLDAVAGVILGQFTGTDEPPGRRTLTLDQVWADYFGDVPYPVVTHLQYGHLDQRVSMPVGVRARLEATETTATLSMLEPVVARLSS